MVAAFGILECQISQNTEKMCDKNIKMFDILNGNWFSDFQMNGAKITFSAIWVFQ